MLAYTSRIIMQAIPARVITAWNKHFDIQLFKSREVPQPGIVDFTYIPSSNNAADRLTKALAKTAHCHFLNMVGLQVQP